MTRAIVFRPMTTPRSTISKYIFGVVANFAGMLTCSFQVGKQGHSSLEDAQATMKLYRVVATDWEKVLASGYNFWAAFKEATPQ